MLFRCILSAFLVLQLVAAKGSGRTTKRGVFESTVVTACSAATSNVTWSYASSSGKKGLSVACVYEPSYESFLYCIYDTVLEYGGSNETFEKTFKLIKSTCASTTSASNSSIGSSPNFTPAGIDASMANATKYMKNYTAIGRSKVNYPVRFSKEYRDKYYNAYHGYYFNFDCANIFGGVIIAYFGGILILAGILHYMGYTSLKNVILRQQIVKYVRGYLILPTLSSKHTSQFSFLKVITGYMPTSFEAIIVLIYVALHTAFMACRYQFDPYNIIFQSHSLQVARFLADRSGIMAFTHFPLIVLFAGRNNFLQYVSGIRYTSFIVFHKWLGRMMFMDAVIHAAAYTHYSILNNSYSTSSQKTYWKFGISAVCLASTIIIFSFGMFRKYFYETFLFLHIVLGALFFYSCWEHVMTLSGIEWVYAALAVWIFDRIFRLVRLSIFGLPKANLKLIGEDLIRLTLSKPNRFWNAKPGQYVFISFLHPLYFWQSHPFTVMDSVSEKGELVIIFKAKKGVTKLVRNYVKRNGGEVMMRVAIEGPYGSPSPLHKFNNVLLLTGGTGLPGPIAQAIELGRTSAASGKQSVKLVVTVRGSDVLNAYRKELLSLKDLNIDLHIYNTLEIQDAEKEETNGALVEEKQLYNTSGTDKEEKSNEASSEEILNDVSSSQDSSSGFSFAILHNGRPDVNDLISSSTKEPGTLGVVCCGHPVFVDSVRNSVAKKVLESSSDAIEYFEELQSW